MRTVTFTQPSSQQPKTVTMHSHIDHTCVARPWCGVAHYIIHVSTQKHVTSQHSLWMMWRLWRWCSAMSSCTNPQCEAAHRISCKGTKKTAATHSLWMMWRLWRWCSAMSSCTNQHMTVSSVKWLSGLSASLFLPCDAVCVRGGGGWVQVTVLALLQSRMRDR